MPTSYRTGNNLLLVREAKQLRILNHIGAVASMAIKVYGNTNIMQQSCCLQKPTIALAQLVQLHPAIEHGQSQLGDMACVAGITFKQAQGVFPAALQYVFGNNGHIISLRIIIIEQAFTQTTAASDQLFSARNL